MDSNNNKDPLNTWFAPTWFAPAERMCKEELLELRNTFLSINLAGKLLEAVPDLAMVLSETRQIIAVNHLLLKQLGINRPEQLMGMRPGELVKCIHSEEMPGGCGTSKACSSCEAVQAILDCIRTKSIVQRDCRISTIMGQDGGALDLRVKASPIPLGDQYVYIVDLRNIKEEKRKDILERIFFHDILSLTGVFALLGYFYSVPITVPIVVAFLTTLGYSLNDTVVIFDRIR